MKRKSFPSCLSLRKEWRMANNKDITLIGEYEELLVLLRQLHKDTPILEKQHHSLKQAFVSAQEKLETTIASADEQITKSKQKILVDFEAECRKIINTILSDAQVQATETLKKIQTEKKSLEALLDKCDDAKLEIRTRLDEAKTHPIKRKQSDLVDGEIYTGEELLEKFSSHIDKDLFVKRIVAKSGKPWNNDYCMLVTGIEETRVFGEIYRDGTMYEEHKGYSIYDSFMIYRGPSEKEILKARE